MEMDGGEGAAGGAARRMSVCVCVERAMCGILIVLWLQNKH